VVELVVLVVVETILDVGVVVAEELLPTCWRVIHIGTYFFERKTSRRTDSSDALVTASSTARFMMSTPPSQTWSPPTQCEGWHNDSGHS
jgi:hypothetical protein